jgi:hypothetical protein
VVKLELQAVKPVPFLEGREKATAQVAASLLSQ